MRSPTTPPRVLAAVALLVALTPPPAAGASVTPPPIDDAFLPPPGSYGPGQAIQDESCSGESHRRVRGGPGQLAALDLPTVWALTRGAGQTVAVIDTGVARHRRLPRLEGGGDLVSDSDGTTDCDGHGTVVAGIIGASTDTARSDAFGGVAPDATILSIRQSSNHFHAPDAATGSGVGDVDTLASAVRTAADAGATVINISSVACLPSGTDPQDRALGAALAYAVDVRNVVVVAAAGNVGGPGQCPAANPRETHAGEDAGEVASVATPAWYDDYVVTVGSVDPDGAPSSFSLAGPWVDVAAPGEQVTSLAPASDGLVDTTTTGDPLSGTSYAAPVVSGLVALIRARSPELTARGVMQRLEDTARHPAGGWNPVVGSGAVDPLAAVTTAPAPVAPRVPSTLPSPVAAPAEPPGSPMRGAAVCLGLAALVAAVSVGTARLRRVDTVADD